MNISPKHPIIFTLSLFFLSLFLSNALSQCPCAYRSPCQIVAAANQIIQAQILTQTSNTTVVTFSANVKHVWKGNVSMNQPLTFYANPLCVTMKNRHTYVISLILNNNASWVDSCGLHTVGSQISSAQKKAINSFQKTCSNITSSSCTDQSGNKYYSGQTWNPFPCQTCTCKQGTISCIAISCVKPPCDNFYTPSGQCCPVCPQVTGQCSYRGILYSDGQSWNPLPCETCHCTAGSTTCFQNSCSPLQCTNTYIPDGQCCPVCVEDNSQSCNYQGSIYSNGQSWSPTACRSCICNNGTTRCVDIQCLNLNCSNAYVPVGQCCAICPQVTGQCVYQGKTYSSGQSWNPSPCRSCSCSNGVTTCAEMQCPVPNCPNAYVPTGQCCPVCPQVVNQCLYKGQLYSEGQTWNPSDCESCSCHNGVWTCVTTVCGQSPCSNPYTVPGQCCPVCPTSNCYDQNGNTYVDGQQWSPLGCQNCSCNNGTTRCIVRNCIMPTCSNWYIPSGQCCPVCPLQTSQSSCTDSDGKMYANGASWEASPCRNCSCSGGTVNCVTTQCETVTCPGSQAPYIPDGGCCPVCPDS